MGSKYMIIEPKIRGFISPSAHPKGCYEAVLQQINYVKAKPAINGAKNVLVIGASTGYGLASRIVSTFAMKAKTVGVFFERKAEGKRTASAGWYNTAAFEEIAHSHGFYAASINGDAFSKEIKTQTADLIESELGKIDLVIYSLAAPRRKDPFSEKIYQSALKPIATPFKGKTIDPFKEELKEVTIQPAEFEEIENTVAVMGGDDWELWMDFLNTRGLLSTGVTTFAYSYIGPEITHAIYKNGTIGQAKNHLKNTADKLSKKLKLIGGHAYISVNKALVTQASAAIPVVPLYIALLFKIMKERGTHEGCIEQMYRLLSEYFKQDNKLKIDEEGFRLDDLEMDEAVQAEIKALWNKIDSNNVTALTDLEGYREDFYHLFGFHFPQVDYSQPVDPNVEIQSLL